MKQGGTGVIARRTVLAVAVFVATFEALRRLNDGHVEGIWTVPLRPLRLARGPHGLQP